MKDLWINIYASPYSNKSQQIIFDLNLIRIQT